MRNLATIRLVDEIIPIENKDRIEIAIFGGWQIIVKKDEFKVGDKAVFIEIDSVLPDKPEFEFLKSKKFRIKTMKMSGVVSQGICFPLDILPKGNYEVNQDVTDVLGIKQYEATMDSEPTQKEVKHKSAFFKYMMRFLWFRKIFGRTKKERYGFPEFISKSDEVRVQNIPHILENKDIKYTVTEKIDGCSVTVFLKRLRRNKFDFGVCSRNLRLNPKDISGHYWNVVKKYDIEAVLRNLIGEKDFIAIQGEVIAPKVQKNKYKLTEPDLFVFNLIYPSGKIDSVDSMNILKEFGVKCVPILETNYILPDTVNELLEYATGESKLYTTLREGIVLRNAEKNVSFKAVSPKFLLNWDE